MTREEATKIFRKEIECLSHSKCEDCILEKVCDPMRTTPFDSEYIEAYKMAIQALQAQADGDLISRQDLIVDLSKWWFATNETEYNVYELYDAIHKVIKDMPTVAIPSAEPKWIPVSERLPEDRREVLVTAYWHETYQVMMASYYGDGLWWCVPFNNCGEHMQRLNPKAWMPLPEPYEAESEDKE